MRMIPGRKGRAWSCRRGLPGAIVAAVVAVLVGGGTRAHADFLLNIVPTFDSTITSDPNAAAIEGVINSAISYYNATFTTRFPAGQGLSGPPGSVGIQFRELSSGLGSSSWFFSNVLYTDYLTALTAATSGDATDTTALAHLPA